MVTICLNASEPVECFSYHEKLTPLLNSNSEVMLHMKESFNFFLMISLLDFDENVFDVLSLLMCFNL